jgi:ribosomal protein L37AE/L43A
MDDERPPICPACGVTMVPAALSARERDGDWICLECEAAGEPDAPEAQSYLFP